MTKSRITILVVEDDKFISNAYKIKFDAAGFTSEFAYDGQEALTILENFTPDIIILDLVMPIKNGFEVLKVVKKDERISHIPIIVATNLGQEQYIVKAKEMGAVDYILKSELSLADLVIKIKTIVSALPKHS